MIVDIIFLIAVGATWAWINEKVREDSGGEYENWLDALLDGLKKAQDSLENAPEPLQPVLGLLLGILESAGKFLDTTITEITGSTDSVGEFFYNLGTLLSDATFESFEDIADKIENLGDRIKEEIELKIKPYLDYQTKLQDELADVLEGKTRGVATFLEELKENIKNAAEDQIEEAKTITTDIDYVLRDQTYESFEDLQNAYDRVMTEAYEKLYESHTIADTYLNRDIFNTTLQMNMWADLLETATSVDVEKAKENMRAQLEAYKDIYFEIMRQYKDIAEEMRKQLGSGA